MVVEVKFIQYKFTDIRFISIDRCISIIRFNSFDCVSIEK